MNWKEQIVQLVLVKQAIDDVDVEGLWDYCLPELAATPDQLAEVERALGEPLDPGYRAFLEHAGGWLSFWQSVDLFGPADLLGSERFAHANELLGYIDDEVLAEVGFQRAELLPIASSQEDINLFVMSRRSSSAPGTVVWLAPGEIDRWPSFDEFYLAMVDYNRLEYQALRDESQGPS